MIAESSTKFNIETEHQVAKKSKTVISTYFALWSSDIHKGYTRLLSRYCPTSDFVKVGFSKDENVIFAQENPFKYFRFSAKPQFSGKNGILKNSFLWYAFYSKISIWPILIKLTVFPKETIFCFQKKTNFVGIWEILLFQSHFKAYLTKIVEKKSKWELSVSRTFSIGK